MNSRVALAAATATTTGATLLPGTPRSTRTELTGSLSASLVPTLIEAGSWSAKIDPMGWLLSLNEASAFQSSEA